MNLAEMMMVRVKPRAVDDDAAGVSNSIGRTCRKVSSLRSAHKRIADLGSRMHAGDQLRSTVVIVVVFQE